MSLTNEQIYEGELAKLRAEIDRLKAVIVSDTHVLLSKRPVAFRIPDHDGWIILQNEESAQIEAEHRGVEYQGLYARGSK